MVQQVLALSPLSHQDIEAGPPPASSVHRSLLFGELNVVLWVCLAGWMIPAVAPLPESRPQGIFVGMLNVSSLALVISVVSVACGSGTTSGESAEHNRAAVLEADGSYSFYGGHGVGDAIAGGDVVGEDYPAGFMALKVPGSLYTEALQAPQRVKTVSLEVTDPSIEMIVHFIEFGSTVPTTLYFHPGDPWVTGYAQVGVGADNVTVGLFEVIKWNRDTSGTMPSAFAQEIHTTGLLPDDNKPTLKYADRPVDPLPPNWI